LPRLWRSLGIRTSRPHKVT